MAKAIGVTLTTGTPTPAQWCDTHALPHLATIPLVMVTAHGVTGCGTARHCDEGNR